MPFKYSILLLSYVILSANYCNAQAKLEGLVYHAAQDPIPYATISLSGGDAGRSSVSQADSAGHFIFNGLTPGNYTVSVYSPGYEKQTRAVHVAGDTMVMILLKPLSGSLQAVTVVGSKPVIERKADRIIYNVANSISAAGSNGLETLGKVPGLKISGQNVSLAGQGTLGIMVNGRLLHLSDKALVNYLKSFSAGQISKIEVITHPSAGYDAEGNAGLVNIITRQSDRAGFSGDVQGSVSRFIYKNQPDYKGIKNYGDINGGLDLSYNSHKWSVYSDISYTAGRELWGYGIDVYYPEKHWAMKDTGEYRTVTYNLLAGADYQVNDKTTVGFEYIYNHHIEDGADYVRVPVYNSSGKLDSSLKTYATYYPVAQSNSFNLHLIQDLNSSGGKLTLNADYFNFYRHDRSDFETRSYNDEGKLNPGNTKQYYDTALQNIRIYTFKADMELPTPFARFSLGSKISFINNYSNIYYYHKVNGTLILDNDLSNEFRYIENTQAVYGNGRKTIGKWSLDAGLRAELTQTAGTSYFLDKKINKHYLKLFPSLLASYKMDAHNDFSFSYNKRIHRPTFWNLNPYKSLMTAYTYVEGNPNLEPEYITNIALSHTYKRRLTSTVYMKVINNGFTQFTRTNTGSQYMHITTMLNFIGTQLYGLSESLSVHPFRWIESTNQVNACYTIVHADLSYINGIKGFGLYAATNNTFSFNKEKTMTGVVNFWYQFPEIDHFGRSDAYYKLDIGLQALVLRKKLSLSLNATDLLQSGASVVHTTVNHIQETFTNFQILRNIKLSATWHFGHTDGQRKRIRTGNEAERDRVN